MQTDCFPNAISDWPRGPVNQLAKVNPRYAGKKNRIYPFVQMASVGENFAGMLTIASRKLKGSGLRSFQGWRYPCLRRSPRARRMERLHSYLTYRMRLVSAPRNSLSFLRARTRTLASFTILCAHILYAGVASQGWKDRPADSESPDDVFVNRLTSTDSPAVGASRHRSHTRRRDPPPLNWSTLL